MCAQATTLTPQQTIAAAKAPLLAYNEKNWNAVKASITPDFTYDEVATHRKVQGVDQAISAWQGWANAIPDSKATFHNAWASGTTVVLEVTWQGTHKGPMQMPTGPIAATGKRIDIRACIVSEIAGDKVRTQRHYFDMATLLQQIGVAG
ncbi:MAG TPA: ester cyclase [Gemmatimonadales bacterium]|jgi:steroid delta-isomerase-like uncharacterized protein